MQRRADPPRKLWSVLPCSPPGCSRFLTVTGPQKKRLRVRHSAWEGDRHGGRGKALAGPLQNLLGSAHAEDWKREERRGDPGRPSASWQAAEVRRLWDFSWLWQVARYRLGSWNRADLVLATPVALREGGGCVTVVIFQPKVTSTSDKFSASLQHDAGNQSACYADQENLQSWDGYENHKYRFMLFHCLSPSFPERRIDAFLLLEWFSMHWRLLREHMCDSECCGTLRKFGFNFGKKEGIPCNSLVS